MTSPLQNASEIQFVPHRNHITSPLQNAREIHFIPHRKHITSPLRAQQVNAIDRFVTMVYCYNYLNSGHYPSSFLLFKEHDISKTGFCLRLHVEPTQLDPIERASLCLRMSGSEDGDRIQCPKRRVLGKRQDNGQCSKL
jgi:hypothetical protein